MVVPTATWIETDTVSSESMSQSPLTFLLIIGLPSIAASRLSLSPARPVDPPGVTARSSNERKASDASAIGQTFKDTVTMDTRQPTATKAKIDVCQSQDQPNGYLRFGANGDGMRSRTALAEKAAIDPILGVEPYDETKMVTSFGADKTGISDSSAAFRSAIASAASAGGGTVVVPYGTYRFSTAVTIPTMTSLLCVDNTVLLFPNATNGIILTGDSSGLFKCTIRAGNANSGKAILYLSVADNMVLNVRIDSDDINNHTWAYGFYFSGAKGSERNTVVGGKTATASVPIYFENHSSANSFLGHDITLSGLHDHFIESLGVGGDNANNSYHGGVIEGAASTAAVLLGGSDSFHSFGTHYEIPTPKAACVIVDTGAVFKSSDDAFGCNYAVISGNTSYTRSPIIYGSEGGAIVLGPFTHRAFISGYYCSHAIDCITDAAGPNSDNTIIGSATYLFNRPSFGSNLTVDKFTTKAIQLKAGEGISGYNAKYSSTSHRMTFDTEGPSAHGSISFWTSGSDGAALKRLSVYKDGGLLFASPKTVATLPVCSAATVLLRHSVTDATVAIPGSPAVGGGSYTIGVQCIFNSSGSAYSWIID